MCRCVTMLLSLIVSMLLAQKVKRQRKWRLVNRDILRNQNNGAQDVPPSDPTSGYTSNKIHIIAWAVRWCTCVTRTTKREKSEKWPFMKFAQSGCGSGCYHLNTLCSSDLHFTCARAFEYHLPVHSAAPHTLGYCFFHSFKSQNPKCKAKHQM